MRVRSTPKSLGWLIACGALLWALPAMADPALDDAKPKIAVLDFSAQAADPELAATLTSIAASELQRLRVFSVITNQDLRAVMTHEAIQQMAGCEGSGCTAQLGSPIGARYLLSGSVGKVSGAYVLSLVLTDLQKGLVVGRSSANISDAGQLSDETARAARKVVAVLLAERQGSLFITCSEQGATVKIDGEIVGVTPLPRRSVSWGPHELRIEKEGFIAGMEDLSVTGSDTIERYFVLIPSDEFLKQYQTRARGMRIGAWVATGAAVVALGTAAYFQIDHITRANQFSDQLRAYQAESSPTLAQWNKLAQMHAAAENSIHWTYGLGVTGLAFAGVAAYLWIAGPDPSRYARYQHTEPPKAGTVSWQFGSPDRLVAATVVLP